MQYPHYLLVAGITLLSPAVLHAQIKEKTTIESATVFLNGAELTSTAHVNLVQGENDVLFTNVAGNVNQQSLNISADKDVVIESSTFQNNYLTNDNLTPRGKELKDSIEIMNRERNLTNNKIAVIDEQLSVLAENKKVGGNKTGLSVIELQKMLDLLNVKLESYLNNKLALQERITKIDERLTRLNQQLGAEQNRDFQPGGQLRVKFYAAHAASSDVIITYVVPNAGWSPTYDLRVDKVNDPVHLLYKANVYQNSGIKWNNVHIILSTGNPSENAQSPVLTPNYLAFYQPPAPMPMYKNSMTEQKDVESMAPMRGNVYQKSAAIEQSSMNQYVQVDNAGINAKFDISLPYSIPSDGQQHLVAIKTYDMPASYRYYAVPKLNESVFLQAQVTNWEDLNLLPGNTNIFYEGSYVGQGSIDMRNTNDTLNFSLGKDKKIIIKRELDKERRSVKMIGSNVRETFAYNISIRNTRKEPADVVILDQVPVSNDKDIVIEDIDKNDGDYNENTGEVKWELNIKPNDTKKLHVGYTVKYPKGKTITGLR